MTRRSSKPAKPHSRTKAAREKAVRESAPTDDEWSAGIREQILDACHPLQLGAVTDPGRRYSFLVGRGGTKTTTFMFRGTLLTTSVPRAKVLYFASTRQRAMDLLWFPLKALLHNLGIYEARGDVTFNETALRCTITKTGATYQLSGLQDIADADKWRGSTFDEVQFDECGAIKPELLEYTVYQVIGPRVRCLGVGGTPGLHRRKLFYDVTRPGSDLHRPFKDRDKPEYKTFKGYSSHHWTLADIIAMPGAKERYPALLELHQLQLEEIETNKWTDENPIKKRELDAVWAADGTLRVFGSYRPHLDDGAPWNLWDPFDGGELVEGTAGLRIAIAKLRKTFPDFTDWRHVVAMDLGGKMKKETRDTKESKDRKDPFACSVLTFSPHDPDRRQWQTMSFERPGYAYGKPIAELLIGADEVDTFIKTGKFPTVYGGVFGALGGWPDGSIIDTNNALLEDLKNVYGIKAEKADQNKNVKKGSIELTNGEFHEGRLFLIKGGHAAQQCEDLQWKEQEDGTVIEDPAQANHCFAAGTMVMTEFGERAIESVRAGDRVWTRSGLRAVRWSGPTGMRATMRATMTNGRDLVATADHKIWTQRGWVRLDRVTEGVDMLTAWENTVPASRSHFEGSDIDATRRRRTPACGGISPPPTGSSFTAQSGLLCADQSLRDSTCTTRTETTRTTASAISRASTEANTSVNMAGSPSASPYLAIDSNDSRARRPPSGIARTRDARGTARTRETPCERQSTGAFARSAGRSSSPRTSLVASAVGGATPAPVALADSTTSSARAPSAERSSNRTSTTAESAARLRVVCVIPTGRVEMVFDLTVEDEPEFFANGVLVHNSSDTIVYGHRLIAAMFESGQVTHDAKTSPPKNYSDPMGLGHAIETGFEDDGDDDKQLLAPNEWSEDDEEW